jgi:hypothetical protein
MKTLRALGLIVLVAVVLAGIYGAVHNQVSYTVSPEYFTKFKFRQFGLVDAPLPERVRASLVGALGTWSMGIPIGLLVGAAGLIHRNHHRMLTITLQSLAVAVAFTFFFELGGLLYGYLKTETINLADYRDWSIPDDVLNVRRFLCAGYMHAAGYLGGVTSILVAWGYHAVVRFRSKDAA